MSVTWAGTGPQLLVELDREGAVPLRVQLEQELRAAIRSGRLAGGERLPSSRLMAVELGVSRGLVQECYAQLQAEGYLEARSGSATRVAAGAFRARAAQAGDAAAAPAAGPGLTVDFRPGRPDLAGFPRRDWLWALHAASAGATPDMLGYGDPRGSARLREVVASYVRRVRGAVAEPEHVVICAGFIQGLDLLCGALAQDGGGRIAFEDPGKMDHRAVAERWGLEAVTVPVDALGVDVGALAACAARAVVVTPAHQAPTGVVLAPERRRALIDWATARDALIIEDDYDSEFRYDREPIGVLQGLAPHQVATIGTVSKALSPGLRLGWIICPPHRVEALAADKACQDRGLPALNQLALATLMESGRYDRHLRRMRVVYAKRRQTLIDAFAQHAPHVHLRGLAAGLHTVALLPDGLDEEAVVAAAGQRGVGLYPMSRYRTGAGRHEPALVMGFGDVGEHAIERGVETIADLLVPTVPA